MYAFPAVSAGIYGPVTEKQKDAQQKIKRSAHWQYKAMTPNQLEEGADLWS